MPFRSFAVSSHLGHLWSGLLNTSYCCGLGVVLRGVSLSLTVDSVRTFSARQLDDRALAVQCSVSHHAM